MPFITTSLFSMANGGCQPSSLLDDVDLFWGGGPSAAALAKPVQPPPKPLQPRHKKVKSQENTKNGDSQKNEDRQPLTASAKPRNFVEARQPLARRHRAREQSQLSEPPPRTAPPPWDDEPPRSRQERQRHEWRDERRQWQAANPKEAAAPKAHSRSPRPLRKHSAAEKAAISAVGAMVHPQRAGDFEKRKVLKKRGLKAWKQDRDSSRSSSASSRSSSASTRSRSPRPRRGGGAARRGRGASASSASSASSVGLAKLLRLQRLPGAMREQHLHGRAEQRLESTLATTPTTTPPKPKSNFASAPSPVTTTTEEHKDAGEPRRKRRSMWDVVQNDGDQVMVLPPQQAALRKKVRECYVGNLARGTTTEQLHEIFRSLFRALPAYLCAYGEMDPVVRIQMPPQGQGAFAFVEFADVIVTVTAIQMSGFELNGRSIRIGRPQGYSPAGPETPPLDVQPLRESGLLPLLPEVVMPSGTPAAVIANKLREIYVGNLTKGETTEAALTELLLAICAELPEYNAELGPPITRIKLHESGAYCFVQLQNGELATQLIEILNEITLCGRPLRVNRPTQVKDGRDPFACMSLNNNAGLPTNGGPPDERVEASLAMFAGAAAAADLSRL